MANMREKLIAHLNRKGWWHCPPEDSDAYRKRGRFYASSFHEAEFWGRPLDDPQHVNVLNPLIGDEDSIEIELFGKLMPEPKPGSPGAMEWRWKLDAKMKKASLSKGYDSIVVMTPKAFAAYRQQDKMPRSIELNVLNP